MYNNKIPMFESLEDRVLLSASPIDDIPAVHAPAETQSSTTNEILFTGSTQAELNTALQNATEGDTLVFQSDVTITFSSEIAINKAVNLKAAEGVSVTFDGQGQTRILNYNLSKNADGSFKDLSITGNIVFENANTVETFTKVTIDPATQEVTHSGIYTRVDYDNATAEEKESFVALTTTASNAGKGGAIVVKNANLTVDGITIQNSTAFTQGGAIWHSEGSLTVCNSTLTQNYVSSPGGPGIGYSVAGAVYSYSSTQDISTPVNFVNNTITENISQASTTNFDATSHGGAVYIERLFELDQTTYSFTNNIISNNTSLANSESNRAASRGAGIYFNTRAISNAALTLDFTGNTISKNSNIVTAYDSSAEGAGIYTSLDDTSVIFFNNLIDSNSNDVTTSDSASFSISKALGAGIYTTKTDSGVTSFTSNKISNNSNTIANNDLEGGRATLQGAGVFTKDTNNSVVFSANIINNNSNAMAASQTVTQVINQGAGVVLQTQGFEFHNNTVYANSLDSGSVSTNQSAEGAGLYIYGYSGTTQAELYYNTIYANTVSANSASTSSALHTSIQGGVTAEIYGNVILGEGTSFVRGGLVLNAENNVIGTRSGNANGGDIEQNNLELSSNELTFEEVRDGNGQLLYLTPTDERLVDQGGAHDSSATAAIEYLTDKLASFATVQGDARDIGAIEAEYEAPSLIVLTTDSYADLVEALETVADGGTIQYNSASDLTVPFKSTLHLNQNVTIENVGTGKVTFDGLNTHRILNILGGSVNIDSITFSNGNSWYGSAIEVTAHANLTVENSTFSANYSSNGGVIHLYADHGNVTVNNSTFANNTGGGSLNNEGITSNGQSTATITITNTTIVASEGKTALNFQHHDTGSFTLTNNILLGGIYYGGGAYSDHLDITNNIMMDFVFAGDEEAGLAPWVNLVPVFNDIVNNNVTNLSSVAWNGSDFIYTTNGQSNSDFRASVELQGLADNGGNTETVALGLGSIAINAGVGSGADQRGESTLDQKDIGAFESQVQAPSHDLSTNLDVYINKYSYPDGVVTGYLDTFVYYPDTQTTDFIPLAAQSAYGQFGQISLDGNGVFIYTIYNLDSLAGQSVSDTFVFTEQGGSRTVEFTLDITVANTAPVIGDTGLSAVVTEDSVLTVSDTLTGTDTLPNEVLTWSGNRTGQFGDFVIDSTTGTWTYTLNNSAVQNLSVFEKEVEYFSVTLTDSQGATSSKTVQITVTGTNDTPSVSHTSNKFGVVTEDSVLVATGSIVANDVDNNSTIIFSGNASGQYGTFTIDPATGTWTYSLDNTAAQSLDEGEFTVERFYVAATDETGAATYDIVEVLVQGAYDSTGQHDATVQLSVNESLSFPGGTVTVNGYLDPLTDDFQYIQLAAQTVGGNYGSITLDGNGGFTYTSYDLSGMSGQTITEAFIFTEQGGSRTVEFILNITIAAVEPVQTIQSADAIEEVLEKDLEIEFDISTGTNFELVAELQVEETPVKETIERMTMSEMDEHRSFTESLNEDFSVIS